jgi:16S rRNA (guanine966-N2)-methyltransferase
VLRIAGGSIRGRKLAGPKGLEFRPTTGRIREFVFFALRETIPDARFLDLFAGTGSLGLEALSRGAGRGVFVEGARRGIDILERNIETCGFGGRARILCDDVFAALRELGRRGELFDVVFADPPFKEMLRSRIQSAVEQSAVLKPGGILMLEHDRRDPAGEGIRLVLTDQRRFGDCTVSFYLQGK